jgi:KaiB domain
VSGDQESRAEARRPFELVLYVSPGSPASARAQRNIQDLIGRLDRSQVDLDVRDVSEDAERAEADRILFIPTLVVRRPLLTWIVGDLTNGEEVLRVLRSVETEESP